MQSLDELLSMPYEKRREAFLKTVTQSQMLWILADEDGAVMLVAEDEDCIPVWPSEESAKVWQDSEWQSCSPKSISISDWQERWTPGMLEDELCVVIFPVPGENGMTSFPDEFEQLITNGARD